MDPSLVENKDKNSEAETLAEPLLDNNSNVQQHDSTVPWTQGTVQPPAYRDVGFAISFYAHLVVVVVLACMMSPSVVWDDEQQPARRMLLGADESGDDDDITARQIIIAIVWVLTLAIVSVLSLLAGAIHLMATYPIPLIQGTLIGSIGVPVGLGVVAISTNNWIASLPLFIMAGFLAIYARTIWGRIPYAASNLKTALAALRSRHHAYGLVWTSLGGVGIWTVWMILWGSAGIGVGTARLFWATETQTDTTTDDNDKDHQELTALGMAAVGFLVLSNYWVGQVIKNVLRTTVAGTVGTWWFDNDDDSSTTATASSFCCSSPTVSDSLYRSTTFSFGSICFGSLVVAVLHTIRDGLRSAQRNRQTAQILSCILECLVLYVEKLVEYFNKWSFIYVGLYGYGYVEASKKVMQLFQERNWMPVVADDLVNRLLGIVSLTVSLLAALMCFVISRVVYQHSAGMAIIACCMGFVLAVFLSNLLIGIISSAVDTIIVCYAEAPTEFRSAHPVLAEEMENAWTEAWRDPQSGLILISLGSGPGVI